MAVSDLPECVLRDMGVFIPKSRRDALMAKIEAYWRRQPRSMTKRVIFPDGNVRTVSKDFDEKLLRSFADDLRAPSWTDKPNKRKRR